MVWVGSLMGMGIPHLVHTHLKGTLHRPVHILHKGTLPRATLRTVVTLLMGTRRLDTHQQVTQDHRIMGMDLWEPWDMDRWGQCQVELQLLRPLPTEHTSYHTVVTILGTEAAAMDIVTMASSSTGSTVFGMHKRGKFGHGMFASSRSGNDQERLVTDNPPVCFAPHAAFANFRVALLFPTRCDKPQLYLFGSSDLP